MWLAGSYNTLITTGTRFRINKYTNVDNETLNSITELTITPRLDQYVVIWPDEIDPNSGLINPIKVTGG
jgi:hypothetical protein